MVRASLHTTGGASGEGKGSPRPFFISNNAKKCQRHVLLKYLAPHTNNLGFCDLVLHSVRLTNSPMVNCIKSAFNCLQLMKDFRKGMKLTIFPVLLILYSITAYYILTQEFLTTLPQRKGFSSRDYTKRKRI